MTTGFRNWLNIIIYFLVAVTLCGCANKIPETTMLDIPRASSPRAVQLEKIDLYYSDEYSIPPCRDSHNKSSEKCYDDRYYLRANTDFIHADLFSVWHRSIEKGINLSKVFTNNGVAKIRIKATLFDFFIPGAGFKMESMMGARYEIINLSSGTSVASFDVWTNATATTADAFWGSERSYLAVGRALEANVKSFLEKLNNTSDEILPIQKPKL